MPTRDQERAAIAFTCVTKRIGWSLTECKEYTNMARSASALIRASGLAQALEFIDTRSKNTQQAVLADLGQIVLRHTNHLNKGQALKTQSRNEVQLSNYMMLTRETLACLQWLARFGKSVLED